MKKKLVCLVLTALMVLSIMPATAFAAQVKFERPLQFEENIATELKKLNLFKGVSETDFALKKVPTRIEALVIMLRLMGKETEILAGSYKHPFTDVPSWANNYVGYAYENGLTKGISASKFGTDNATDVQFLTFVLRAMGYSDSNGDFTWDNPYDLAEDLGVLDCSVTTGSGFLRADCASISYNALSANLKDGSGTLADKLIGDGVFTKSAYENATNAVPDYASVCKAFAITENWISNPTTDEEYWYDFQYAFLRGAWKYDKNETMPKVLWKYPIGDNRPFLSHFLLRPDLSGIFMNQCRMSLYCKDGRFYMHTQGGFPELDENTIYEYTMAAYDKAMQIHTELWESGKIKEGMTQKQIAQIYVNYLCGIQYTKTPTDDLFKLPDHETPNGFPRLMKYDSAYACLINHQGDCGSRAAAYNLLMHIEGIDACGLGVEGHIINYIILDGEEWYCDWGNGWGLFTYDDLVSGKTHMKLRTDVDFIAMAREFLTSYPNKPAYRLAK